MERLQIFQMSYENQRSTKNLFRVHRRIYGLYNRPTRNNTINNSLFDNIRPNRPHLSRSKSNIVAVDKSASDYREKLIRHRS